MVVQTDDEYKQKTGGWRQIKEGFMKIKQLG